jgi:hypothetical protein
MLGGSPAHVPHQHRPGHARIVGRRCHPTHERGAVDGGALAGLSESGRSARIASPCPKPSMSGSATVDRVSGSLRSQCSPPRVIDEENPGLK